MSAVSAEQVARDWLEREWSEDDVDAHVRGLARLFGWLCYHSFLSIRSTAGYPDLTLVRPPRVLYVELKRETGKVTRGRLVGGGRRRPRWVDGQAEWLRALASCPGVEVYVWRPSTLEEAAAILHEGPRPGMACVREVQALVDEGGDDHG